MDPKNFNKIPDEADQSELMQLEQNLSLVDDGNPSSDVEVYVLASDDDEEAQLVHVPALEDPPEDLEQSIRAHLSEISGRASIEECIYALSDSIVVTKMMPGHEISFDEERKVAAPEPTSVTFLTKNYEKK